MKIDNSLYSQISAYSSNIAKNKGIQKTSDKDELRESVDDFVSVLVSKVFKDMYNSIPKSGFINENLGDKWFKEMLIDEYSKKAAKENLKSIGDMIYRQIANKR